MSMFAEYDALSRLGIEDPQGYVARRYCTAQETVVQLESCAVGDSVLRELEAAIEDIHNSDVGWIDVLVCMYVCGGGGQCAQRTRGSNRGHT